MVNWIDWIFRKIKKKQKHFERAKQLQSLKTQVWDLKEQVNHLEFKIVVVETDISANRLTLTIIHDYGIQILR